MSTALDAERDALEADRNRLTAEAADLRAERRRMDSAEAALGAGSDPEQVGSFRRQEAAYDARLEAARRTETALQRRARDLNAKIMAYNNRLLSAR